MFDINSRKPRLSATAPVAACAAAAALGWITHGALVASRPVTQAVELARPRPAPAPSIADQTLIAVASDGLVTLRVEQQPLQWVLEQVAEQARWPELAAAVGVPIAACAAAEATAATPSAAPPASHVVGSPAPAPAPRVAPPDLAQVQQLIASDRESERLDGLWHARAAGLRWDETALQRLFEADPSEQVRMAAFETYLAMHADNRDVLRAALQAALHLSSPRIRHDAQLRLDALDALERHAASASDDP